MSFKNKTLFAIVALTMAGSMACADNILTLVNMSGRQLGVTFDVPLADGTSQIQIPADAEMSVKVGPGWIGAPVNVTWENGYTEPIFFVNRDGAARITSEEVAPQSPTGSDSGDNWSFSRQ